MFLSKRAFTLIELIIVISVIGMLVLLVAPKFITYTQENKYEDSSLFEGNVEQVEYGKNQEKRVIDTEVYMEKNLKNNK